MSTYCIIGKLKLVQIEGSKTLQLGYFGGLPYAVSKDFVEDKLYCIFLPDGQLSKEYFEANKEHLSFFGKNRKVRSIKLMQGKITSVGYVADIESLAYTGYDLSKLKEGDSFNELNGVKICNKFVTEFTKAQSIKSLSKKAKVVVVGLPEHKDTEQFYKFSNTLEAGDLITITLKLDGTSVRVANAYTNIEQKWYHRLIDVFVPVQKVVNKYFTGTRRVIIQQTTGDGYYGSHDMYLEVGRRLEGLLHPGESVYGEIVGWKDVNKPLFTRGGMRFLYGCEPGKRDFYVYNIKWTLPDGSEIDLPWNKIKSRCLELGIKYVPEMEWEVEETQCDFCDAIKDSYLSSGSFMYDGNLKSLEELVYFLVDGPDLIDPSHIREGIVLRVEKSNGQTVFFKAKSQAFYELEDKSKEAGEVDIEEINDV